MPIRYNSEIQGWECYEPTLEEKKALTQIAVDMITEGMGREIANRLVAGHFGKNLEEIPPENMGQA